MGGDVGAHRASSELIGCDVLLTRSTRSPGGLTEIPAGAKGKVMVTSIPIVHINTGGEPYDPPGECLLGHAGTVAVIEMPELGIICLTVPLRQLKFPAFDWDVIAEELRDGDK